MRAGFPAGGGLVGIVVPDSAGGILGHTRSLLSRLPALGWDVRVCAPPAVLARLAPVVLPAVRLVAVEIARTPLGVVGDVWGAVAGEGLLRRALAGVDVVLAEGLRAGHAALGAGAPGIGRLVVWHNPPPAGVAGRFLAARVARGATVTLAASADLVAAAAAAGGRRVELLEVAAPAMPPGDPGRAAALRRVVDLGGRSLVVTAGRLARQKDHATAVRALLQLPRESRPVLAVAGEGPERSALQRLAAELGVSLRLLGERTDVGDLLLAADVAVLSSRWEARSLFAQEALRAGVPLVATAVGGLPGLLGPAPTATGPGPGPGPGAAVAEAAGTEAAGTEAAGTEAARTGTGPALLVPPGDPAAMAAALDRVLGDRTLAAALTAAGRARAAGWPDEDHTARAVAAALVRVRLLAWDSVER